MGARFSVRHGDNKPGRCPLPGRVFRLLRGIVDGDNVRCSCGLRWDWGRYANAFGVPRRGRAWIRRG